MLIRNWSTEWLIWWKRMLQTMLAILSLVVAIMVMPGRALLQPKSMVVQYMDNGRLSVQLVRTVTVPHLAHRIQVVEDLFGNPVCQLTSTVFHEYRDERPISYQLDLAAKGCGDLAEGYYTLRTIWLPELYKVTLQPVVILALFQVEGP